VGLVYDSLGATLLVSFVTFLGSLGALILLTPVARAVPVGRDPVLLLLVTPVLALAAGVLLEVADSLLRREDLALRAVLRSAGSRWWELFRLELANVAVGSLVVANVLFYATRPSPGLKLLSVPFLYLLAFLVTTWVYQAGLVWRQRVGPVLALKRALLLALDNPGYTAALCLAMAAITAGCVLAVIPLALVWPGLAAVVALVAVDDLLAKYDALDAEGKSEARGPCRKATSPREEG
jgi:hypothetical protein